MNFTVSLVFYLAIGIAVAVAHGLGERRDEQRDGRRDKQYSWPGACIACLFWPLYLPLVLSQRTATPTSEATASPPPADELMEAIDLVQAELDAALAGLDGWTEHVLVQKNDRLRELRGALGAQVARIRDMETLLAHEHAANSPAAEQMAADQTTPPPDAVHSRREKSRRARLENMARIERLCRQAHSDLLATLAWIRELVSMIHLARFTGAPAARAEELVAQIAAAVEGISSLNEPIDSLVSGDAP